MDHGAIRWVDDINIFVGRNWIYVTGEKQKLRNIEDIRKRMDYRFLDDEQHLIFLLFVKDFLNNHVKTVGFKINIFGKCCKFSLSYS